jgi:hypothetical protein
VVSMNTKPIVLKSLNCLPISSRTIMIRFVHQSRTQSQSHLSPERKAFTCFTLCVLLGCSSRCTVTTSTSVLSSIQ